MKSGNSPEKNNLEIMAIANIVFFSIFICDVIALVILLFLFPAVDIHINFFRIVNVIAIVFLVLFNHSTNSTFEAKFKIYEKEKKIDVDKTNESVSILTRKIDDCKTRLNLTQTELESLEKNTDKFCNEALRKLESINKQVNLETKRIRKRMR